MITEFVKPTKEHVNHIANNMRSDDAVEVMASHGHTPLEALINGWNISDYSVIVTCKDEPVVMYGMSVNSLVTGFGTPWMLSTDGLLKYRKDLLKYTPMVVDQMLDICPRLVNYVHVDNKISKRWLRWLGFTIGEVSPYGVGKELFHRFHLER